MTREELEKRLQAFGFSGFEDPKPSCGFMYSDKNPKNNQFIQIVESEYKEIFFVHEWILYPAHKIDEFLITLKKGFKDDTN